MSRQSRFKVVSARDKKASLKKEDQNQEKRFNGLRKKRSSEQKPQQSSKIKGGQKYEAISNSNSCNCYQHIQYNHHVGGKICETIQPVKFGNFLYIPVNENQQIVLMSASGTLIVDGNRVGKKDSFLKHTYEVSRDETIKVFTQSFWKTVYRIMRILLFFIIFLIYYFAH